MKPQLSVVEDILGKISKLRALGKSSSEMDFWESVAKYLTQEEQIALLQNFNDEISLLEKK